jgi:hypothetical protein
MSVKLKSLLLENTDDLFIYTVTTADRLESIAQDGLIPGAKRSIGSSSLDGHAKGRLFFTEKDGLSFWLMRAEQSIEHNFDDYAELGIVPVILRAIKNKLVLTPDEIGTSDSGHLAFFTVSPVEPNKIEIWNGSNWVGLDQGINPSLGVDEDGYLLSNSPLQQIP